MSTCPSYWQLNESDRLRIKKDCTHNPETGEDGALLTRVITNQDCLAADLREFHIPGTEAEKEREENPDKYLHSCCFHAAHELVLVHVRCCLVAG